MINLAAGRRRVFVRRLVQRRRLARGAAVMLAAGFAHPTGVDSQVPAIRELESGTSALLQAVSAPSESVVWVSGHEGVVLRTTDGGASWRRLPVQTGDSLQFRDVHGFDERTATILSAGPGAQSRIYRTTDGGETWALSWINPEPAGFYDCLDFWDDRRGVAYGDAVEGGLRLLVTEDGGASWALVPTVDLPAPAGSEGGFAASGTCVETGTNGQAWIGTGAGDRARVLMTGDHGATWEAIDLPIVSGEAAGAITVVFQEPERVFVLGGDLGAPESYTDNVARSTTGGRTWTLAGRPPFPGAVYGAVMSSDLAILIAAGPGGLASSSDDADSWSLIDDRSYWAVGAAGRSAWAVGPGGRILHLDWTEAPLRRE